MKKQQNKIDEYFREALQHHTVVPSEAAKEAFLKEAATLKGIGKSNKYWFLYLAAFLLVVSAGAGFLLVHKDVVKTTSTASSSKSSYKEKINPVISAEQSESGSTVKTELTATKNSSQKINISLQEKNQGFLPIRNHQPVKKNEFVEPEVSFSSIEKNTTSKEVSQPQTKTSSTESPLPPVIQPVSNASHKSDSLKSTPAKTADTLITEKTPVNNKKPGSDPKSRNWNVTLGGYYSPEWLFNTLEGEKYVNNFGVEGTFHFGRYSVRTGAGLSITKGTNELSIKYNDYLGHYNKLDSIHFAWNPTHSSLVPTYYFSNENVWDSLMKTANAKVIKRYTYLQIPLILGYDFWQNEHFSIGLRAGPILSVLLKTEVLSDNYDPGMNKIILINRIAPERIQTNWQILGGFNATYRFSKRVGIELEPGIRYYFNSVYEKSAIDKKPWSVGIHAAFIVIL